MDALAIVRSALVLRYQYVVLDGRGGGCQAGGGCGDELSHSESPSAYGMCNSPTAYVLSFSRLFWYFSFVSLVTRHRCLSIAPLQRGIRSSLSPGRFHLIWYVSMFQLLSRLSLASLSSLSASSLPFISSSSHSESVVERCLIEASCDHRANVLTLSQYAVGSQIKMHGHDPDESLIELSPREGAGGMSWAAL